MAHPHGLYEGRGGGDPAAVCGTRAEALVTNLRSLLVEALQWMDDHWPELPNESTTSLRERIDAALDADEPPATPYICPECKIEAGFHELTCSRWRAPSENRP